MREGGVGAGGRGGCGREGWVREGAGAGGRDGCGREGWVREGGVGRCGKEGTRLFAAHLMLDNKTYAPKY